MSCIWYADDYATESGPSDFQCFGSFASALASTANYQVPNLVWGSLDAYFAADGSSPFVEIVFNPGNQTWTWIVGANGPFPAVGSQAGGFATAQLALAAMQKSGNQPEGFRTVTMNCDPASLAAASRCWCLPDNRQRGAMLYLLCQWASNTGCTLPTAPVDLGASAGDGQVTLTWPAGVGATGYNIKRSLVSGGPYTVIGTSAASPYVDLTAANGTTYYYVVSSTNACGESAGNSLESHATPLVAVVSDWVQRVQNNGGALPSLNTAQAMNAFVVSLRTCAIESLMISVNCFVPDSLIAAITPLYAGGGNDPWTNNNFVGADLTINGLIGNQASKWLQTGIVPANVFSPTEGGATLYCPETYSLLLGVFDMGATTAGLADDFLLTLNQGGNAAAFNTWSLGPGQVMFDNTATFVGFFSGNRIAANDSKIYLASSVYPFAVVSSIATAGGSLAALTEDCYVFASNTNGAHVSHSGRRFSFAAFHHGLTSVQDQCLYNAVQALRMALGGGYV